MARERLTYTIKTEIAKAFNDLAIKKNINRSSLIGDLMKKWVEDNKENEQKNK